MAFSGPAPEIINGRLAMLGFMAAIGGELASHTTLLAQADSYAIPVGATFAIFMAASFVPILNGSNLQASSGIWTPTVGAWMYVITRRRQHFTQEDAQIRSQYIDTCISIPRHCKHVTPDCGKS